MSLSNLSKAGFISSNLGNNGRTGGLTGHERVQTCAAAEAARSALAALALRATGGAFSSGRRLKSQLSFPVCGSGPIRGSEGAASAWLLSQDLSSEDPALKRKPVTARRSSSPKAGHGCPTPSTLPLNAPISALAGARARSPSLQIKTPVAELACSRDQAALSPRLHRLREHKSILSCYTSVGSPR